MRVCVYIIERGLGWDWWLECRQIKALCLCCSWLCMYMCRGPIEPDTVPKSAILIMQQFIKSSRWVSEWEKAVERIKKMIVGRGRGTDNQGEIEDRKSALNMRIFVHTVALTTVEYFFSFFIHGSVCCHSDSSLVYFVTLYLLVMCCLSVQVCTCWYLCLESLICLCTYTVYLCTIFPGYMTCPTIWLVCIVESIAIKNFEKVLPILLCKYCIALWV